MNAKKIPLSKQVIYTDQELIAGLAQSDSQTIAEIYRLYQPMLTKWMVSRGGNETDAYDVFQEGLVVLYEKSTDTAFCLTCKLSTYLFAICKRIWFKKSQAQHIMSSLDMEQEGDQDEALDFAAYDADLNVHLEKEAHLNKLEQSLDQLGSPCSELLKAFYIEDKSMLEIAQQFSYTNAENAKTQKYKCLNRLKKLFFSTKMALNV